MSKLLSLNNEPQVLLTTQNIFITNLAISDLLMCIFTIPITLMDILKYWPDGDNFLLVNIKIGFERPDAHWFG
jgi:hypothetical protein